MKKTVLILNFCLPIISLVLYSTSNQVSPLLWVLVLLLCLPSLAALRAKKKWLHRCYWSATLALMLVIGISSMDLWSNLLNNNAIPLANHLLVLLIAAMLVANLQMHTIQFRQAFDTLTTEQQVSRSLEGVNLALALIAATIACNLLLVLFATSDITGLALLAEKFLQRGIIPPLTLLLFCWGSALLVVKIASINNQSLHQQLQQAYTQSSVKSSFFDCLWQYFERFYVVPRYINWAIPILGFIGTVLGISLATQSLASLLDTTEADFSQLLSSALSPLGIAFDTTLIALSLSVILTLVQTLVFRWEEKQLLQFEQSHTQQSKPKATDSSDMIATET